MIVIKLGGSVIQNNPFEINPKTFELLNLLQKQKEKVLIVNGGGPLCRILQSKLKENSNTQADKLNQIGITVNNMYGEFLRLLFPENETYPELIITQSDIERAKEKIEYYKYFVGGAEKFGHTSDYNAVVFANAFGVNKVLRITNVDYLYDKDPKIDPNAKKIEKIDWAQYLNMFESTIRPGGNYPFDPVASKFAMENGIKVYLTNIDNIIKKQKISFEEFEGSVIG